MKKKLSHCLWLILKRQYNTFPPALIHMEFLFFKFLIFLFDTVVSSGYNTLYFFLFSKTKGDFFMARIIKISDFLAPELDVYARLTQAQLRSRREPEKGIFIAESPKVIEYALNSGCRPISMLMEEKHITGQAKPLLDRCEDLPVYTASRDVLAQLTGYELTRGILCAFYRPVPVNADTVCQNARRLAVLEGIVDSTNLGAIFRSAAALSVDGILLSPTCSDPLSRRCVRVSMGTVFQIPWARMEGVWPEEGLRQLHQFGFKTAAMALNQDSVPIDDPTLCAEEKLAILLGTEGTGLTNETIARCDYTVLIPMSHNVDSLNVAAASAVAFWQLRPHS